MSILLDDSMTLPFIDPIILDTHERKIFSIHQQIHSKTGPGYEYLGWVDQPGRISSEQIREIEQMPRFSFGQFFVLVGIGGLMLEQIHHCLLPILQNPSHVTSPRFITLVLTWPRFCCRLLESLEGKDIRSTWSRNQEDI